MVAPAGADAAVAANSPGCGSTSLPSISDRTPLATGSIDGDDGRVEAIRRSSVEVQRFVRDASQPLEGIMRAASEHGGRAQV